jgi:carboxymethylenebutenolidase
MSSPVQTRWITIAVDGGRNFDAYLALPPGGTGPGLVLFQEIFGVNEHVRSVAEQYALAGFVVLAPDVFWRSESRVELGYVGDDRERGFKLVGALKPVEVLDDIQTAVAALRARPETAGSRCGAIGYCMGGRLAYVAAATTQIEAAVAYYGGGIHEQLHLAGNIKCPMQFHFAGKDDHIPPAAVAQVRQAMTGAEVLVYPEAMHGFNCWARAAYHAPSSALALGRSLQFLSQLF